jgi:hypothetical protein
VPRGSKSISRTVYDHGGVWRYSYCEATVVYCTTVVPPKGANTGTADGTRDDDLTVTLSVQDPSPDPVPACRHGFHVFNLFI